ncbi:MAG: DUF1028 domain-containing protein [Saprospiraceae bacterium]
MKKQFSFALFLTLQTCLSLAQDTFSIVAVDSLTGEVGSAGASCISATNLKNFFPNFDPDFLGDLLPGRGAINTQASYLQQNQLNARARLAEGMTPQAVVNWLAANDAQSGSTQRQYGVAALQNGAPMAAAFTGANCLNVKAHRVGPNYSIQGNILSGAAILDSMEARFLAAGGCLANRLMAAMQGANVSGADSRCASNGTSSMFAFLKVAAPGDSASNLTLRLFVSYDPVGIEPIDSLQALFDTRYVCVSTVKDAAGEGIAFRVSPNPTSGELILHLPEDLGTARLDIFDAQGRWLRTLPAVTSGERLTVQDHGLFLFRLVSKNGQTGVQRVVVE